MTTKKAYLILQTVLCTLLVIILISTAVGIYRDGLERKERNSLEGIYTREIVAEKLRPVAPLFFLSLGIGIAGLVLDVKDEKSDKPVNDAECKRNLIVSRVAEPNETMKRERRRQKTLLLTGWFAFAACMVPILLYMSEGEHFPNGDLEAMIADVAMHVIPWMALAIACLMTAGILQEKSILREIKAAQARLKEEKEAGIQAEAKPERAAKKTGALQTVLILAAIGLILAGIFNGGSRDVLYKAAKICTECVGLG